MTEDTEDVGGDIGGEGERRRRSYGGEGVRLLGDDIFHRLLLCSSF